MIHLIPLLATVVTATAPIAPQDATSGPVHEGYDPTVQYEHRHDGPLGAKLLHVESQLRCSCGCSLDVHLCQFQMQCGTSPVWSERILKELGTGATEEAVVAGFVADYGQVVLMAPPAEGFNWLGYLLPPAALVVGGILVGVFLRGRETVLGNSGGPDLSPEDWERLEEEIRLLDEETDW